MKSDLRLDLQAELETVTAAIQAGTPERAAAESYSEWLAAAIAEDDDIMRAREQACAVICSTIRDTPERAAAEQALDVVLARAATFEARTGAIIYG